LVFALASGVLTGPLPVELFFIRTLRTVLYDSVTRPEDDFYWHSVSLDSSPINGEAASIAIPRKSRVILYDRAANLSVLIRNSTVQEMNPYPIFFSFSFSLRRLFFFSIMFNVTVQFHFFYVYLILSILSGIVF